MGPKDEYSPLEVVLRKGEEVERLIKRFLRKVKKEGILEELRKHDFFLKPSAKKRKQKEDRERVLQKLRNEQERKN